ncbi:MAG: PfkB family carbohydrate kinase [Acidobacteriia bacterium]|nr:PfkB family carbohydrate kinase [Terriglobia bacterium]
MSILVVGSVAFDCIKTPLGEVKNGLGGSATYFSLAASFFSKVNLVAVVGDDFTASHEALFHKHGVDLRGLQRRPGKSFFWSGEYGENLNECVTRDTQLNVFAEFAPEIPREYQSTEFVFLANIDPTLQHAVMRQVKKPKLVALDTMNYWIHHTPEELRKTLRLVDLLMINDNEARLLTGQSNVVAAAEKILTLGPRTLVVKRGEYGVSMFRKGSTFVAPAFPLKRVCDPTGAGDSFAGGFMGYLAATGAVNEANLRRAVVYGSVMASFKVEDFTFKRLLGLRRSEIDGRFRQFEKLTHFDGNSRKPL